MLFRSTDPKSDSDADIARPGNGDIAALAYQLWMERGCPIGSPDQDWFLAEAELTKEESVAAAAA